MESHTGNPSSEQHADTAAVGLLADEAKFLGNNRCFECGHLAALHNSHCCNFCKVTDCRCEWGGYVCQACKMIDAWDDDDVPCSRCGGTGEEPEQFDPEGEE